MHGTFSSSFAPLLIPYKSAQDFLKKSLNTVQQYQTLIVIASISAVTAAYIGYAIYLDGIVNDKNSLWHWSMHHIKDGIIDQEAPYWTC